MGNRKYYYKNNSYHNNYKKNKQRHNNNMNNYDKQMVEDTVNNKIEENLNIDNEIIENDFEVVLKKKEVPVEPIVNQETLSNSQIDEEINNSIKNNTIINFNEEENEEIKEEVIKKPKKNYLIKTRFGYVLGVIILLLLLLGTTYSYFNYTSETNEADIASGDMYVKVVENTVNLSNKLYPMTKEDARSKQDNVVTFNVKGLNTSDKTIYYEVKLNYGESKNSPYVRFNDKDLVFDLVEVNGNNETYVVNARSYSDIANGARIWVDTIDPNTTTEVTKTYKLRMWLSDKVTIDDDNGTYPASTYRNYYASIKASVYGDLIEKELPGALNTIKKNVITPVNAINFANLSSDTNGKGLYILPGTESDTNPIYYYRGAVDNNNVVFGGFCWQMVRTTDTGGIKMIYNGIPDISGSGANITYNCGTTREVQDDIRTTTSLQQSTGYFYADDYEIVSTSGNSVTYRLKSKTNPITQVAIADATDASTNIPIIAANYPYTCMLTTDTGTCTILYKVDSYASGTNANVYSTEYRTIIGNSAFNSNYTSASDVGYMSNTRYPYSTSGWTTNALFASAATWVTDHYELTDASVTTPDTMHHYSCNQTTANATCTSLRYVYYVSGITKYYITLANGELVEDALYKMTGNGDAETKARNSSYNLNLNNSPAKTAIDNWFRTNLTSEVDANNPDYSVYLEDTIWCNDRSYKTSSGNNATYEQSGWNPSGGSLSTNLYFGTWNRCYNSYYSTTNVPSILCPNETDRFTTSNTNGNGALTYPVGLLTEDEIIMAGVGGNGAYNSSYYLYTNVYYWSLSPGLFDRGYAYEFFVGSGDIYYNFVNHSIGLRPVVSLKLGTEFVEGGDGTTSNPYVVKMS